jgi:hypothetical protein
MTTAAKADRIPLEDMREIITRALEPGDYQHDSEWARPPECPCHGQGRSCLAVQAAGDRQSCQGHVIEIDTPEPHVVTAEILTAALPQPDHDGTLDSQEAALSVLRAAGERLGYPYILRRDHLVKRLTEESEAWEQAHGIADTGVPEEASDSVLRCMVCTRPLKAGSRASRRTCSDACRQRLSRIRNASVTGTVTA